MGVMPNWQGRRLKQSGLSPFPPWHLGGRLAAGVRGTLIVVFACPQPRVTNVPLGIARCPSQQKRLGLRGGEGGDQD